MDVSKWHTRAHASCETLVKLTDHALVLCNNDPLDISDEVDKNIPFY